jgi:hypothetical protein
VRGRGAENWNEYAGGAAENWDGCGGGARRSGGAHSLPPSQVTAHRLRTSATASPRASTYSDCNALAGLRRAARDAGIVVARTVIAVISRVAIAKIAGSDALIAYTRLEMTWPEK